MNSRRFFLYFSIAGAKDYSINMRVPRQMIECAVFTYLHIRIKKHTVTVAGDSSSYHACPKLWMGQGKVKC